MVMCARRGRYTTPVGILSDAKEAACCVIHPLSRPGQNVKCGGSSSLPKTRQDSAVLEHQWSIQSRSQGVKRGNKKKKKWGKEKRPRELERKDSSSSHRLEIKISETEFIWEKKNTSTLN